MERDHNTAYGHDNGQMTLPDYKIQQIQIGAWLVFVATHDPTSSLRKGALPFVASVREAIALRMRELWSWRKRRKWGRT
jgi:hypothetical protein